MCGIAGYWDLHSCVSAEELHRAILGMTQWLRHRGPDSGGLWIDRSCGVALGHRRLAIRDLSSLGHQPMRSPDGRLVLTYNGEIYNAQELAERLDKRGIRPRGTSDTEILLLSLMTFGIGATLEQLLGMFAFAVWDTQQRRLTLARDRFGVKPLYWSSSGGRFLFASEIGAFSQAGGWAPAMDVDTALPLYLQYGYIPAPYSIWRGVQKLEAAHRLDVDAAGEVRIAPYWDSLAVALTGLERPLVRNDARVPEQVVADELDTLLTDAVRRRMVADVPLGSFLSGGIDSSLVTALMQKESLAPVRTFSIGFEEADYNEAPYARAIANHLGTEHTEAYLPARDAWEIIPQIAEIYGEPFGDPSAVPTTLLCRLTRQGVITALSGDGGDELFGGYWRYGACLDSAPHFHPAGLFRRGAAAALRLLPPSSWDRLAELLPARLRPRNAGTRIHNFADFRLGGSFEAYYRRFFMQYFWHPDTILRQGSPRAAHADALPTPGALGNGIGLMQYLDAITYLPGCILTKVDRASMSCGLEVRVPLLDHRVYALAWRIPEQWRLMDGKGKYLLRKVLERYVPSPLIDRPKMGFGIPLGAWITGPLRPWAEELLDVRRLENDGVFRPMAIRKIWDRHLQGASNWEFHLWFLLMFQAWLNRQLPAEGSVAPLPVVWN